jgi:uncharacterized repeat protein (TIGR03803 family)
MKIKEFLCATPRLDLASCCKKSAGSKFRVWKMFCLVLMFCAATAIAAPAQSFTSLVSFDTNNGAYPQDGALAQGLDGDFFGTTSGGGLFNGGCFRSPDGNCGVVFKITAGGTLTVLHKFTDGTDGSGPMPGLVLDPNGDFYGSNSNGGNGNVCFGIGCGVVFRLSPGGRGFISLVEFDHSDTANSNSVLVQTTNGNLYGTGVNGGAKQHSGCSGGDGCGSVFEVTPEGTLTNVHSFDFTDGWDPDNAPMVQAPDFALYGETAGGGTGCSGLSGCGTLFKMTLEGALTTLHKFNGTDGIGPSGGLVEAADGNFYGTTQEGGVNNDGTVFKITPAGTLTTLHNFAGTDGEAPKGGLVLATDGNFYGTTSVGGAHGDGTIFQITPAGALNTLHNFNGTDGSDANSVMMQATNGIIYGTTYTGGKNNVGTVFSLSMGLAPFVKTVPARGKVGKVVKILGNNLTGANSVTFNGTAATFTVVLSTEIEATVPADATTGTVEVTTPSGTLKSNVPFLLTP